MIFRILWIAFILTIAGITAGIQLDRQSRRVPSIAQSVPEPFRAFAQKHVTSDALLAERNTLALVEARKLVARRPMPAAHLRLLSLAEFHAEEAEAGVYSIQLSARRGWRDRGAQRTMLQLAQAAGDQPEAARRFAALFVRRSEQESELRALAEGVFGPDSEEARATFATILAGAERWHRIYLRKGPIVIPADALVDMTRRATDARARFDCKLVAVSVKRLRHNDPATAEAFKLATDC